MALSWMKDSVVYQIYPQSFQDSNGDGIGDFRGIIERLDYIRSLGVNVIWMNPCFDSPFGDAGYDVRDFYRVAPRYGTEQDLIDLFDEAHRRGMRVILDLVAGHTSMDNAWFVEEAKNPKSPDSNRYIWENRDFDPEEGPQKEDFVSNFFWYQPALNYGYENPTEPWQDPLDAPGPRKNRAELRNILSYWFDRGCDGFRVDMAGSLIKGGGEDKKAIKELWQDVRAWMDECYPGRALVAEWSLPDISIPAGFHLDFLMHFNAPGYPSLFFNGAGTIPFTKGPCYFDAAGRGSLDVFRQEYAKQLSGTRGKGYISLPSANHDFQRLRCGSRGWEGLRPAWVFLMTQAGVPTIYYGDEIGMRFVAGTPPKEGSTLTCLNLEIAPNAGAADGERSGTRTPMQWDNTPNNGFSTAAADQLYLPVDDCHKRPTVQSQESDPDSLLHFVRRLTKLRTDYPALGADGEYKILNPDHQHYPLVVERKLDRERCLVIVNPTDKTKTLSITDDDVPGEFLLNEGCTMAQAGDGVKVSVAPFGYGICIK